MKEFDIPQNSNDLYPEKQCLRKCIIEKLILWISLICAAAKNFKDTVIIASVDEYSF
jgi:phosphoribosylaminoimidazolecarboxamide formyltransferase/IMP cyclohydrolase